MQTILKSRSFVEDPFEFRSLYSLIFLPSMELALISLRNLKIQMSRMPKKLSQSIALDFLTNFFFSMIKNLRQRMIGLRDCGDFIIWDSRLECPARKFLLLPQPLLVISTSATEDPRSTCGMTFSGQSNLPRKRN